MSGKGKERPPRTPEQRARNRDNCRRWRRVRLLTDPDFIPGERLRALRYRRAIHDLPPEEAARVRAMKRASRERRRQAKQAKMQLQQALLEDAAAVAAAAANQNPANDNNDAGAPNAFQHFLPDNVQIVVDDDAQAENGHTDAGPESTHAVVNDEDDAPGNKGTTDGVQTSADEDERQRDVGLFLNEFGSLDIDDIVVPVPNTVEHSAAGQADGLTSNLPARDTDGAQAASKTADTTDDVDDLLQKLDECLLEDPPVDPTTVLSDPVDTLDVLNVFLKATFEWGDTDKENQPANSA